MEDWNLIGNLAVAAVSIVLICIDIIKSIRFLQIEKGMKDRLSEAIKDTRKDEHASWIVTYLADGKSGSFSINGWCKGYKLKSLGIDLRSVEAKGVKGKNNLFYIRYDIITTVNKKEDPNKM